MAIVDSKYHRLLSTVLEKGFQYEDPNREGVIRKQIPHYLFEHDFVDGFPLLTTKKMHFRSIVGELLWFLRGEENIKYLVDQDINIWNKDAYDYYVRHAKKEGTEPISMSDFIKEVRQSRLNRPFFYDSSYYYGDVGRNYGVQWRTWSGSSKKVYDTPALIGEVTDQIHDLIDNMRKNPMGTRHLVNAWNPGELDETALPPCHHGFIVLPEPLPDLERFKQKVDYDDGYYASAPKYGFRLKWYQRSTDVFLGLPFNISSYATLAHILGKLTNMVPLGIIGDLSNVHIYESHMDAVKEQLGRDCKRHDPCFLRFDNPSYKKEIIWKEMDIDGFLDDLWVEHFELLGYTSYPAIKAEMLSINKI